MNKWLLNVIEMMMEPLPCVKSMIVKSELKTISEKSTDAILLPVHAQSHQPVVKVLGPVP